MEHAAKTIIRRALTRLLAKYPDINVEVIIDYGLVDVVADRFDAGVRLGEQVAKDMIAVRMSPEIPMATSAHLRISKGMQFRPPPPKLVTHRAINLRLPTTGVLNAWRFIDGGCEIRVHVDGPLVFNTIELILDAAVDGLGLAYMPLDQVTEHIADRRLIRVLADSTPPLPGYHLYCPSRRHSACLLKP